MNEQADTPPNQEWGRRCAGLSHNSRSARNDLRWQLVPPPAPPAASSRWGAGHGVGPVGRKGHSRRRRFPVPLAGQPQTPNQAPCCEMAPHHPTSPPHRGRAQGGWCRGGSSLKWVVLFRLRCAEHHLPVVVVPHTATSTTSGSAGAGGRRGRRSIRGRGQSQRSKCRHPLASCHGSRRSFRPGFAPPRPRAAGLQVRSLRCPRLNP